MTGVICAHAVGSKEVTFKRVRAVVRDVEPAMKPLAERVELMRSHHAIMQESPEYEPQANGLAATCVQAARRMCTTTMIALAPRRGD